MNPAPPKPKLVITLGDPAGIGSEIILKALADPDISELAELTVIGHRHLLEKAFFELRPKTDQPLKDPSEISIIEGVVDPGAVIPGRGDAQTGSASFAYLTQAIRHTLAGRFAGIVTAPIAKYTWHQAGHFFPGQTEVLAQLSDSPRYGMLFVARSPHNGWQLRTLLATTHIPLRQVPDALTPELVQGKLDLLDQCLRQDFGLTDPQIAVAGLNPHSGEAGQLGREELEWLTPLLETYPHVQGPIPPDTMWIRPALAWQDPLVKAADGYLALYHDQGLIPVKMLAFDRAVNTTIGLPFVRTSPDHGTAFDIAGRGVASASSLKESIRWAADLARIRGSLRN